MDVIDGTFRWETVLTELGAAYRIKHDPDDGSLYVTGSTIYIGSAKGGKIHALRKHDTCAVVLRLSASYGKFHWERTMKGSPRWGVFDQSGGVELANENDGPYIYVAFDDLGEGSEDIISLDAGSSYAGCKLHEETSNASLKSLKKRL